VEDRRKQTWIGLAIIALVALVIVALPSGGTVVTVITDSLQAAFLLLLGLAAARLYRTQSFWLSSLSDRDRGILFGAIAVAVFAIAAKERFQSLGSGGLLLMYAVVAACGLAAFWVWRESRRYAI